MHAWLCTGHGSAPPPGQSLRKLHFRNSCLVLIISPVPSAKVHNICFTFTNMARCFDNWLVS